ncbi:MAG: hypothetical protein ACYCS4_11065 [Acidimicrobiales bacterium]
MATQEQTGDPEFDAAVRRWMAGDTDRTEAEVVGGVRSRSEAWVAEKWSGLPRQDRDDLIADTTTAIVRHLAARREAGKTELRPGLEWGAVVYQLARPAAAKAAAGEGRWVRTARRRIADAELDMDLGIDPVGDPVQAVQAKIADHSAPKGLTHNHVGLTVTSPVADPATLITPSAPDPTAEMALRVDEATIQAAEDAMEQARRRGWRAGDPLPEAVCRAISAVAMDAEVQDRQFAARTADAAATQAARARDARLAGALGPRNLPPRAAAATDEQETTPTPTPAPPEQLDLGLGLDPL